MDSYSEIEAFLSAEDAAKRSRREHHLPRECYAATDAVFAVTMCARRHGEPFRTTALATGVIESLRFLRDRGDWRVYAYCLMPDHLHVIVQLGQAVPVGKDLLTVMERFRSFTTRLAWRQGFHGGLWQHDQYDSMTRTAFDFTQRCTYVLNNPVRKGWVGDWTLWPYSGILDDW